MKDMNYRGVLTPKIKEKAEKYLGREFTQKELRLYPYIQYCCVNSKPIDRRQIDKEEFDLLEKLDDENRIIWDVASCIHPSREFWTFICDIIADGYVERSDE